MEKITLIHGDAAEFALCADLVMTDPPFDMPGGTLQNILERYEAPHMILITTMRQLLEFMAVADWRLGFDFVLDGVVPKKSKSLHQPNYVHQTGVYLMRPGIASAFNRKRRQRSDVFEGNGYWPTLLRAPRENMQAHGMAKNRAAMIDLLGSFDVANVIDPFAGSGSTGVAAFELGIDCTLIEKNSRHFSALRNTFRFLGAGRLTLIEGEHENVDRI